MAKIHRSTGQRISQFASARRKNRSAWDQLELLIIPGVLIAGAFFVHDQVAQKQKKIAASLAKQEVLSTQTSNNLAQSSINSDLPESEQANGEQVLTQTSTDTELFWLDRSIREQLLKSLKRADLIRSNGKTTGFSEITPSNPTELLGIKPDKADPTSINLKGDLLRNLFSTTDQELPRALLIANNTRVNLSGIDLFENQLTRADLFEPKLIKADFRVASFSKGSLIDMGFPGANLFGANTLGNARLNRDLSKTNVLNTDLTSARQSRTKPIKIVPLGSNLSKINLIEAVFGTAVLDTVTSNPENPPKTNPSSNDLNPQEGMTGNLGATDFSEPSQIQ